jgi:hypothetical protein
MSSIGEEYDPGSLIALCNTIVEDGELANKEIYQLAKWLNDHPESHSHWPGYVLFTPLKDVFSDSHISKSEARHIGRLIQQVLREWAQRQADVPQGQIELTFNPYEARMPAIPREVSIASHSEQGRIYTVDLRGPSCTCSDYRSHRSALPEGDLTRCCKHILAAYSQVQPDGGHPLWLGAFIEHAWQPHPKQKWQVVSLDTQPILISSAPSEWANVFAPASDGGYDRFGYNVTQDRWSYGVEPPNSVAIANFVTNFDR